MPEPSQAAPELDVRLAEIDRRLRAIQVELAPGREPRPARPPVPLRKPAADAMTASGEQHGGGRTGPLAEILQRAGHEDPGRRREPVPREGQEPRQDSGAHEPEEVDRIDQIAALGELQIRLLSSSRDLLEAYQSVLEHLRPSPAAAPAPSTVEVTVSAGPFTSLDAVRAFEQAISEIPGVLEVAVRGYERGDRAIVDVELAQPTT